MRYERSYLGEVDNNEYPHQTPGRTDGPDLAFTIVRKMQG
jgi:hypothetical protein